jgi:phosphoribosylformimino-5-aminoimidazole carboxamide ribotide isomerase
MLILPAIDLKNGQCVRLSQGVRASARVYDGDPVEAARRFEAEGARMLHVVDLDGAFDEGRSPSRGVAREIIRAVQIPVQFGGGLRSVADVRQMIEGGARRVVIGTLAIESPELFGEMVRLFGARIAVGIDAKDGRVVTHGWEKQETVSAVEVARSMAMMGVARIIYTDVVRDGMLQGINVEQTRLIARASGVPVTASGGVSSLADLKRVVEASADGVDSVIVGKALYEKRFTLREALRLEEDCDG